MYNSQHVFNDYTLKLKKFGAVSLKAITWNNYNKQDRRWNAELPSATLDP